MAAAAAIDSELSGVHSSGSDSSESEDEPAAEEKTSVSVGIESAAVPAADAVWRQQRAMRRCGIRARGVTYGRRCAHDVVVFVDFSSLRVDRRRLVRAISTGSRTHTRKYMEMAV
jgi:hypothetical protein